MRPARPATAPWLAALWCAICVTGGAMASQDKGEEPAQGLGETVVGPIPAQIGCRGMFVDAPALAPPGAPVLYDDCTPAAFTVTQCTLAFGQQFCLNGHWTILCRDDGQCPDDMRCAWDTGVGTLPANESFGWCAKRCNGGAAGECTRSDLSCDTDLRVCLAKTDGATDEEEPCRDSEIGLSIHIDFDTAECAVYDDAVRVDIGGTVISETDESESVVQDYNIDWPAGVRQGAGGMIEYYARGEGVMATGMGRFVADPQSCVQVEVKARCAPPSYGETPGN
jgi:hypothetical protein